MNVFDLVASLRLDTSDYENGLDDAQKQAQNSGKKLSTAAKVAIGAAVAGGVAATKSAIDAGMDFDKAMSQVAATMGKTMDDADVNKLRDFAQKMGSETVFSATQAAEALNYMALAGYDAEKSMSVLPSVLNLAAAGNFDLATASDMVTDTETAFGFETERTAKMVDEMAKAASTGNTSVQQLGDAFLTVGGLAQELNGGFVTLKDGSTQSVDGIQELEIALTAMANAGIKGSEAGTHMRNILLKLSSPSEDGATSLQNLGVAVFDTEGKMRSLADIFSDLNTALNEDATKGFKNFYDELALVDAEVLKKNYTKDKWQDRINYFGISLVDAEGNLRDFQEVFKEVQDTMGEGLSQEQKLGVISDVFNTRDTASAEALMNAIGSDWDYIGESILQASGAAQQMADTQLDNLAGDVTLFNSALEGTKIALSDEIKPVLRDIVNFASDLMSNLTGFIRSGGIKKITDGFKKLAPVIAGVTAAFVAFKAAMGIKKLIEGVQGAMLALNLAMSANPAGVVALAITGVVAALVTLWNTSEDFRGAVSLILEDIGGFFSDCFDGITAIFEDLPAFFSWVWDGIKNAFSAVGEWFSGIFSGAWAGIQVAWEGVTGWFGDIWEGIQEVFSGAWGSVSSWFGGIFLDAAGAIATAWSGVVDFFGRIWEKIKKKFADVADWFGRTFKKAADKIAENFNPFAIVDVIKEGGEGFVDFTMGVLGDITGSNNSTPTASVVPVQTAPTENIINVNIDGDLVDSQRIRSEQNRNYRSGGRG